MANSFVEAGDICIYIYTYIYIYFKKPSFLGIQPLLFEASKPLQLDHPTKTHDSTEKNGNPFTPSAKLHSNKAGVMPKMPPKKWDSKVFWHATYVTLEVRPWKFNSYSPWKYIYVYTVTIYIYTSRAPTKKGGIIFLCHHFFRGELFNCWECKASFNHPKWGPNSLLKRLLLGT